jgi:GDP-L-fucose synthase
VIPALIRKLLGTKEIGEKEVVGWGDGSPTPKFLYVEEAAKGIVLAVERYYGGEAVNLGSGMEISVMDLVELMARQIGFEGTMLWDTSKPNG